MTVSKELKTGTADIPSFKFMSDTVLKAVKGADGVRRVSLTASSGADDLVGDCMTSKALQTMKSAAPGTTMFLNHNGHQVPEDVFGTVELVDLVTRKAAQNDVLCLDYSVIVEETNPRAVQTWEMIQKGTKLGASVEVGVLSRAPNPANKRGMLIDEIFYITCCIVGVPCNPQSFVQRAMKALDQAVDVVQTSEPGEPVDDAALQDILHKTTTTSAVVPGEESQSTVPLLGATADKAASAGTASSEADSSSQAETETEKPVTAADVSEEAIKGMFAVAMANQKPRPYELFEVLCSVLWKLSRLRDANLGAGTEDAFDYIGACRTAVEECAAALVPSFIHHFGLGEMQAEIKAIMSIPVLKALTTSWTSLLEKSTSVGEEEREVAQSVHDLSARLLGVTCVHPTEKSASEAELSASPELVETVNKQLDELETAKKGLEDQLAAKEVELGEWKATAETATELLEKFCKQPLDASPASVASSVAS